MYLHVSCFWACVSVPNFEWNPGHPCRVLSVDPAPQFLICLLGDLLYLDVVTLEGVEHYVTACPSGFFLNRSTARDAFNPMPKKTSHHSTHLVGLLSAVSV